jgi:hypothetical protein
MRRQNFVKGGPREKIVGNNYAFMVRKDNPLP